MAKKKQKTPDPTEAQSKAATTLYKLADEMAKTDEPWVAMAAHRTRLTAHKILKGTTAAPKTEETAKRADRGERPRTARRAARAGTTRRAPQGAPKNTAPAGSLD